MGTVLVTSDTVPTHWPLRTLYLSLAGWYKQVSRNIHTKVWVGYILVIGAGRGEHADGGLRGELHRDPAGLPLH